MPENVIGLLFEIGADPSKAEEAMAKLNATSVAESAEIGNIWKAAMGFITGPTGIALGAIAGLGGGMLELANKAAEAGNVIYEASEKTGLAAKNLSGLRAIAQETGGSFDNLTVALGRASVNLQNALIEPSAISAKVLANVMGSAQNLANLGLKPMDDRLQIVLHRIFELNDVGQRNQALQALMGRGWQENVESLELLAGHGYAPAIEMAKKFGAYFDTEQAEKAHRYGLEMHLLQGEISGLGLKIGEALLPSLTTWLAELHTVNYEVQLLGIGLKAQAISLVNFGGIFDSQLDKLAARATHVYAAEHLALAAFKKDIEDMGKLGGEHGPLGALKGAAADGMMSGQEFAYGKLPIFGQAGAKPITDATVAIDGMTAAMLDSVQSFSLWAQTLDQTLQKLPLASKDFRDVAKAQLLSADAVKNLTFEEELANKKHEQVKAIVTSEKEQFTGLAQAMIQSGMAALLSGQNVGKAMETAAKATLASIAVQAAVQALMSMGLYFYDLATMNPLAPLALTSAEYYGSVAALAGAASAALPGGSGGASAAGPASSGGSAGASGGSGGYGLAGPGARTASPTVVLQVDGTEFARAVVPTISQQVQNGTVRLTASTTVF